MGPKFRRFPRVPRKGSQRPPDLSQHPHDLPQTPTDLSLRPDSKRSEATPDHSIISGHSPTHPDHPEPITPTSLETCYRQDGNDSEPNESVSGSRKSPVEEGEKPDHLQSLPHEFQSNGAAINLLPNQPHGTGLDDMFARVGKFAEKVVYVVGTVVCFAVIIIGVCWIFAEPHQDPRSVRLMRDCTGRVDPFAGCFRHNNTGTVQCHLLQDLDNASTFHYRLPEGSFNPGLHWSRLIAKHPGLVYDHLVHVFGGDFQAKTAGEPVDENVALLEKYILHMNNTFVIRRDASSETLIPAERPHNFLAYQLWASITNADFLVKTTSCHSDITTASHIQTNFAKELHALSDKLHSDSRGLVRSKSSKMIQGYLLHSVGRINGLTKSTDEAVLPSAKQYLSKSAHCLQARKARLISAQRQAEMLLEGVLPHLRFENHDDEGHKMLSAIFSNINRQLSSIDTLMDGMNLEGLDRLQAPDAMEWIGLSHGAVTRTDWDIHKTHVPGPINSHELCMDWVLEWEAGLRRILGKD